MLLAVVQMMYFAGHIIKATAGFSQGTAVVIAAFVRTSLTNKQ